MFELLPQSEASVYGFKIIGKLTLEDEKTMIHLLNDGITAYGKVRLLINMNEFTGSSPAVLWEDLKWMTSHITAVERLAIVVDSDALAWMIRQDARIAKYVGVEEKHFKSVDIDAAWDWLVTD
ncbi:STAS/SEC14 domain-containing protein [Aliamphritea ceti]|uniref:STAS/SEC14 domain-containing protein n=1 Tax=Aliamphritea ceti TaxID=1524258 RepID=UPI0021C390A8|nr:STAS/SEC14 domain-containing protein [Aliamphritea ceti]